MQIEQTDRKAAEAFFATVSGYPRPELTDALAVAMEAHRIAAEQRGYERAAQEVSERILMTLGALLDDMSDEAVRAFQAIAKLAGEHRGGEAT